MTDEEQTAETFAFQLTYAKGEPVNVEIGDQLSGVPDGAATRVIGEILITLGKRFLLGSLGDEADDDE